MKNSLYSLLSLSYHRVTLSSDDDLSIDSDSDNMEVDQDTEDTPPNYLDLEKHTIFINNTMYAFFRLFQVGHFTNPACTCVRMFYNNGLHGTHG